MRPDARDSAKTLEFELDLPRLLIGGAIIAVILITTFAIGRYTATPDAGEGARAGADLDAPETYEDIGESDTLFDRDDGGVAREPGRQLTSEKSQGGSFEVHLGQAAGRADAERVRASAARLGVPAMVVRAPGGVYRIAAGPFSTRADADRAAARLRTALSRDAVVFEKRAP